MANRKRTKGQTTIYKTFHMQKKKNRATRTLLKTGRDWTRMHRKGSQFLFHMWNTSCYSCYKPGDKSWMMKGPKCDYDKRNISVVICDTDTP